MREVEWQVADEVCVCVCVVIQGQAICSTVHTGLELLLLGLELGLRVSALVNPSRCIGRYTTLYKPRGTHHARRAPPPQLTPLLSSGPPLNHALHIRTHCCFACPSALRHTRPS